jgi:Putative transposase of IS4/5 family (DUF4096)
METSLARDLMSGDEWAFHERFILSIRARNGRKPTNHRLVLDGIFWIARTGSPWRDLPEEFGKWSSIYRKFRRWTLAGLPFEPPGPIERGERLGVVMAMVYLVFNEGYSASEQPLPARAQLCEEAIRLTRLILRLFPSEPEVYGLLALQLLQHARLPARYDVAGSLVLLEHQDRTLWTQGLIAEGLALLDKAIRIPLPLQWSRLALARLGAAPVRGRRLRWHGR